MASFNDLNGDQRRLANDLYSKIDEATTSHDRMQIIVDHVSELAKQADPEYQQFLRLQKKFPDG